MQETDFSVPPPDQGGQFVWKGLILAIVAVPLVGLLLAWTGHVAQGYFAPVILFSVLLGIFSGVATVWLVRLTEIGNRPTIVATAVLTAAVAAVGQHYFDYLAMYQWSRPPIDSSVSSGQDLSALVREMAPSFGQYVRAQARRGRPLWSGYVAQGGYAWLSWAIDALLVVAAATAVTIPATRVPYCNRCRSWYRTIRSGRIDVPTARRLAALAGVEELNHPRSARYRLSSCQGGCGPTRLELTWEEPNGAVDLVRQWLDPAARSHVAAILDGLADGSEKTDNSAT